MTNYPLARECDSWDEYVWRQVAEHSIDWPYFTKYRAQRLGECGMFGIVLEELDRVTNSAEYVKAAISGDCKVCGKPDTGSIPEELEGSYEKPDGETFFLNTSTIACRDCAERVIDDLTTYGEPQPTITNYA